MDIEQYRQLELDYCKSDKAYFIENYVHIEDKDHPTDIIQPFLMWQGQKDTLQSIDDNRLNIILKARQLGVSWLVLAYSSHCLLFNPGYLIIALSRTEAEAMELVRRLSVIYKYMGAFVREETKENAEWKGIKYKPTALAIEIKFPDGTISKFMAFASSSGAGRSFTANILILDEWAFQQFAEKIWLSAYPTINRPTGGKVIGLSTIERGTLFEELYTKPNNFNKIFLPWHTDPRRTPEWYAQTKGDLGDLIMQEYPATVEEALTIPGGSFFPEFQRHIHIVPFVGNENNLKYVSLDYGLDMLAVLYYEVDTKGNATVYKEIHESGLIVSEAAKRINEVTDGEKIDTYYAPPDLWNANRDTGKSTAEIFQEYGIDLIKTSNNREQGCLNVKEYLNPYEETNEQTGDKYITARLVIAEGQAPNLVRCLTKIQKDKQKSTTYANQPHELTHIVDSLRAFCCGRPSATKIKKEIDYLQSWKNQKLRGKRSYW